MNRYGIHQMHQTILFTYEIATSSIKDYLKHIILELCIIHPWHKPKNTL